MHQVAYTVLHAPGIVQRYRAGSSPPAHRTAERDWCAYPVAVHHPRLHGRRAAARDALPTRLPDPPPQRPNRPPPARCPPLRHHGLALGRMIASRRARGSARTTRGAQRTPRHATTRRISRRAAVAWLSCADRAKELLVSFLKHEALLAAKTAWDLWDVGGVSPVPVQMWEGRAWSRNRRARGDWAQCRCGRGEPGPGADVGRG